MIAERDIAVWIVSARLAIGWSRYAKWRTRDKLVRQLAAMDPERREKVLSRLNPRLAMEATNETLSYNLIKGKQPKRAIRQAVI
jgi:hypothetical protein